MNSNLKAKIFNKISEIEEDIKNNTGYSPDIIMISPRVYQIIKPLNDFKKIFVPKVWVNYKEEVADISAVVFGTGNYSNFRKDNPDFYENNQKSYTFLNKVFQNK